MAADPSEGRRLALLGSAVPLLVLALPAVGAIVRWIQFLPDSSIRYQVSVAQSIPELALYGAVAVVVYGSAPLLVLYWYSSLTAATRHGMSRIRPRSEALEAQAMAMFAEYQQRRQQLEELPNRGAILDARRWAIHHVPGFTDEEIKAALDELKNDEDAFKKEVDDLKRWTHDFTAKMGSTKQESADIKTAINQAIGLTPPPLARAVSTLGIIDRIFDRVAPPLDWLTRGHISELTLLLFILFAPGFPALVLSGIGIVVAGKVFDRAATATGRIVWTNVLPALLVFATVSAVSYGLAPYAPRPSFIALQDVGDVRSGWYTILGHADGFTYVRACDLTAAPTIRLRDTNIRVIEDAGSAKVPNHLPTNLFGVLTGTRLEVGILPGCAPHPANPSH